MHIAWANIVRWKFYSARKWEKYEVVEFRHPLLFQVQVCSD